MRCSRSVQTFAASTPAMYCDLFFMSKTLLKEVGSVTEGRSVQRMYSETVYLGLCNKKLEFCSKCGLTMQRAGQHAAKVILYTEFSCRGRKGWRKQAAAVCREKAVSPQYVGTAGREWIRCSSRIVQAFAATTRLQPACIGISLTLLGRDQRQRNGTQLLLYKKWCGGY